MILTSVDEDSLPVPGEDYTFQKLKNSQALGDHQALEEKDLRTILIRLPSDKEGLEDLANIIKEVIGERS